MGGASVATCQKHYFCYKINLLEEKFKAIQEHLISEVQKQR